MSVEQIGAETSGKQFAAVISACDPGIGWAPSHQPRRYAAT
jgi:hypothetical protein